MSFSKDPFKRERNLLFLDIICPLETLRPDQPLTKYLICSSFQSLHFMQFLLVHTFVSICLDLKVLFIILIVVLASFEFISCLSCFSFLSDCSPLSPLTPNRHLCIFSPFRSLRYLSFWNHYSLTSLKTLLVIPFSAIIHHWL